MTRHHSSKQRGAVTTGQTQIPHGFASPSSSSQFFHYNQDNACQGLAESVCIDQLAFNFGEKVGFNRFIKNYVQPAYKPISRKVVKTKIIT